MQELELRRCQAQEEEEEEMLQMEALHHPLRIISLLSDYPMESLAT